MLYNCTTLEVLQSCFGPFGTCPQTAQEALLGTPIPEAQPVPSLALWGLGLLVLVVASLGVFAASRQR